MDSRDVNHLCYSSLADNHNIYDTLELIKKDLKTLEKAVYSQSSNINTTSTKSLSSNDEDVLMYWPLRSLLDLHLV